MKRSLPIFLFIITVYSIFLFAQAPGIPSFSNDQKSKSAEGEIQKTRSQSEKLTELIEQKKEVIRQILADAESLEMSKDRAWALSKAGQFLCEFDKAGAKTLFEKSIKELFLAQKETELAVSDDSGESAYDFFLHQRIVDSISKCDPELAFDYLYQTRPKTISDVLDDFYKDQISINRIKINLGFIQFELSKEDSLKSDIIRKNPERALVLINNDLATYVTDKTLERLTLFNRTNHNQANQLVERAINKLLETQFYDENNKSPRLNSTYINFMIALVFLRDLTTDKPYEKNPLRISDELLNKLAERISEALLKDEYYGINDDDLKTIRRILPDRFDQLEESRANRLKTPEAIEKTKYQELIKSNPASGILLERSKNFSNDYRDKIRKFAVCTMVREENFVGAKELLRTDNEDDEGYLNRQLSLIIYSNALKDIRDKNFDRSEAAIEKMPDAQLQIDAFAFLAEAFYRQNLTKNRQKSLSLLTKAEKVMDLNPYTLMEEEGLNDLVVAYAVVDSEKAFTKLESFVKRVNQKDLKVPNPNPKYKETGMLVFRTFFGSRMVRNFDLIIDRLKEHNFGRTLSIINKINDPKSRISSRISLLEKYVSDLGFEYNIISECSP